VVVVGEVPMVEDGDGVLDDDPGVTSRKRVGLATSETSYGGGEWRLESGAASGVDDGLVPLRLWTSPDVSTSTRGRGTRERSKREAGVLHRAGIDEIRRWISRSPARNLSG
jgi:hypothetical protein